MIQDPRRDAETFLVELETRPETSVRYSLHTGPLPGGPKSGTPCFIFALGAPLTTLYYNVARVESFETKIT